MKKFISLREASEWLGFSRRTIRRWIHTGEIKAYRVGPCNEIRLKVKDIEELLSLGSDLAK